LEQIDWVYLLAEHPANHSALQDSEKDLKIQEETSLSHMWVFLTSLDPSGAFGKTCQVSSVQTKEGILVPSSERWLNSGMGSPTECLTLKTSESHKDAEGCLLSDVLQDGNLPQKYYLSPKACQGIIRRAEERGKSIATTTERSLAYGGSDPECADTVTSKWAKGSGEPSGNECGLFVAHKVYETHPADSRVKEMGDTCQTVTSRWGTGGGNVPLVQAIGVDTYNGTITGNTACTMTADVGGATHSGPKVLVQAYSIREDAKANNFSATPLEVTPALQATRPSVQSHHAQTFVAHTFKVSGGCEGGGKGYLGQDEKAFTLSTVQDQQIAVGFNTNARPDEMKFLNEQSNTLTRSQNSGLFHNMAVRRLTPTECERLQGFPDGYTNIKDNCPDSPRYKALGNSMAVPVMKWIGERIQMVEGK